MNYVGLFSVSDRGGDPVKVSGLDEKLGENSLRHPYFLPDGKHFICFSRTKNLENRGLYLYSLAAPGRKRLAVTDQEIAVARDPGTGREFVLFSRSGKLWAQEFDLSRLDAGKSITIDQASACWLIRRGDRFPYRCRTRLYTWFGEGNGAGSRRLVGPRVAGRRCGFNNHRSLDGHFSIWMIDTARNVSFPFSIQTEPRVAPIWSHDGARVFFQSPRPPGPQAFVKAVDDAGVEQPFAQASGIVRLQDLSADGKILLALKGTYSRKTTLVYTAYGKEDWVPLLAGGTSEYRGQFSPDALFVAYESDESGAWEIYVVDFPAARRKQESPSREGATLEERCVELTYYAPDGALISVAFANGAVSTEPKRLFNALFVQ